MDHTIKYMTTAPEAQKGFYPTPPELADKLLAGIDWYYIGTMLEPSAGKGNLVKAVAEKANVYHYDRQVNVDCVEIDPYLRSILEYEFGGRREDEIWERRKQLNDKEAWSAVTRTQGELTPMETAEKRRLEREYDWLHKLSAPVVHDDFLTFQSRKHYALIVMNPPFADGDAHLLKAIEMQKRWGGQIRCLLNAETLLNPYTNRRKLLQSQLNELGAEVEYIEGGFSNGERATDVTVALIKISIPQVKCGWPVNHRAQWVKAEVTHKAKICIACKVEGQLLLRYTDVERRVYPDDKKPDYHFSDDFKILFLVHRGKATEYAYAWCQAPYQGYDWRRLRNGTECFDESYVYTPNLREVFGEKYYNVNLQAGLSCINNFQGHWDIFDWSDGHMLFCKSLEEPDLENYDPDGRLGIAGWRAYRRKPEEEK